MDVYASKMKGHQWHVVKRFAKASEVIPRTLAENATVGKRVTRLLIGVWERTKSLNPLMAHI
jgi:chaperonin GroEL (HSP60 family)